MRVTAQKVAVEQLLCAAVLHSVIIGAWSYELETGFDCAYNATLCNTAWGVLGRGAGSLICRYTIMPRLVPGASRLWSLRSSRTAFCCSGKIAYWSSAQC